MVKPVTTTLLNCASFKRRHTSNRIYKNLNLKENVAKNKSDNQIGLIKPEKSARKIHAHRTLTKLK